MLLDMWQKARAEFEDPVDAWRSMVNDQKSRARWQKARGKGGFRRTDWDTVLEIMAAANVHTIKSHGPDRIAGFSPIPAMSMISYAAGARMLQLMGGVSLSFYDWYCDLPTASPETWGEQTDVHESADWYNAKLLAVTGSNLNMTRTPDVHFAAEARHNGSKMVVFSPDFSQVSKYADEWINLNAGQDGAWWMAVNHVLLTECHHRKPVPEFLDYTRKFTDAPYLVEITKREDGTPRAGQLLRAGRLADYDGQEFLKCDRVVFWTSCPRPNVTSRGFAVDEATMPANLRVTHTSLFDGTLQGIHRTDKPAFSFQGHPEASPGPHDAAPLFDHFIELIEQYRKTAK